VKNWTLRQRILASFAVIIAIMLLMVVVSYSRLLKIEAGEERMRTDAVPGVYFSSMIRSAWVDTYLQTQEIIGLKQNQDISSEDKASFKAFEEHLQTQMGNYKQTINSREDQSEFDAFEKDHQEFNRIQAAVLDLHQRRQQGGLQRPAVQAQRVGLDRHALVLQLQLQPAFGTGLAADDQGQVVDRLGKPDVRRVEQLAVAAVVAGADPALLLHPQRGQFRQLLG